MTTPSAYTSLPEHLRRYSAGADALNDRVVLITGATGGLGTALAKACTAAGATVILASRTLKKLEALYDVLEGMERAQPAIIPINQETAVEHDYQQIAQTVHTEFGRIDALVHTAADLGTLTPLAELSHTDWTRSLAVNLTSARLLSVACLPLLRASDHASMTFTLDHKTSAYWGAYGISKAGLLSLCQMLADETEGRRDADGHPLLAVNGIDPGAMRTPLRRRAFAGELEVEAPVPEDKLGPFLGLMARVDRSLTATCFHWDEQPPAA